MARVTEAKRAMIEVTFTPEGLDDAQDEDQRHDHLERIAQERTQRGVDLAAFEHAVEQLDHAADQPAAHGVDGQRHQDLEDDPHGVARHVHEKFLVVEVHYLFDRAGQIGFLHAVGQHQGLYTVGLG